jgi:mannose-6-phosphate isomerase-like protein (cupin superfamily)
MKLWPVSIVLLAALVSTQAMAFEPIISTADGHTVIHPNGSLDEVLATREQTGGQFSAITLSDSAAGGGPGPAIVHADESEIWYVIDGTFEFHVGDKVVVGGPGTFVAVDAGQPHGYITKTAGKLLAIFTPGGYEHFFMDWDKMGLKPGPDLGKLEQSYGVTRP